jgi:hypothetical protein
LKSTQVIDNGNGLYFNDLVIAETQINDSGNYICLAVSLKGVSFKAIHLTVLPNFVRLKTGQKSLKGGTKRYFILN